MPELPEVETVVRDVRPQVVGRTIAAVLHASAAMVRSHCGSFSDSMVSREIAALDRQGKFMFLRLSDGNTLLLHLGMTGRLMVVDPESPPPPHTHLRLRLAPNGGELRFTDPRRFGEVLLLDPPSLLERAGPTRLGPDALTIEGSVFSARLRQSDRRLKSLLLDQRLIAGIGNIYADEILHEARLHPARRGRSLRSKDFDSLHASTVQVLRRAIEHGGSTIRDYVDGRGVPGAFQNLLRVYGRAGEKCSECGATIALDRTLVTGRATHFCPGCQPAPRVLKGARRLGGRRG